MYKVFRINKCFAEYSSDEDLVGGKSVEDILSHFDEIYPAYEIEVKHEDWMNEYDWYEECENGKYKEGDIKVIPYFTEEQIKDFKESLNKDNNWPRIAEVPHLFTDTPYVYLTGFGYIE